MSADDAQKRYITRISAHGLVLDAGRILLCHNSDAVGREPDHWTLPGGQINFGEDPRDAVVREVFEETGLHVRVTELVEIDSLHVDAPVEGFHGLRIIYAVEVIGGELTFELDGTTDRCAWFSRDEALGLQLVSLARRGLELAF